MDTLLQQLLELVVAAVDFVPRLAAALVVFVLSLILARLAGRAIVHAARNVDEEVRKLLSRLTSAGIIIVGTIVALDQVNFDVTAFVAGLGIVGFTLGFAFQDIAKNFMAGILLLVQQPLEIGDAIEVAGYQGTVTDVDIRATTIRAWDGQQVVIPNADVYTSAIINYSRYSDRRIILGVGVGYQEDLSRAEEVFLAAIQGLEEVLEDPAPAVYWKNLGSSAVDMEAYFWIDQTESSLAEITSKAVLALKEAAEREGINLPYPIQTVRVHQMADAEPL
ncbi:MAG: mechanosensitive ion channel [Anaerolineae bacterium]|nr:mechanosensitive ion channel [Anaerolineae bacterium]NIO00104.1 mechanosensitive ion channel [Anaerolineae bacterium]NIQ80519.1 mechanosensitive ion channel [Anaerolineae bacterium]